MVTGTSVMVDAAVVEDDDDDVDAGGHVTGWPSGPDGKCPPRKRMILASPETL